MQRCGSRRRSTIIPPVDPYLCRRNQAFCPLLQASDNSQRKTVNVPPGAFFIGDLLQERSAVAKPGLPDLAAVISKKNFSFTAPRICADP